MDVSIEPQITKPTSLSGPFEQVVEQDFHNWTGEPRA